MKKEKIFDFFSKSFHSFSLSDDNEVLRFEYRFPCFLSFFSFFLFFSGKDLENFFLMQIKTQNISRLSRFTPRTIFRKTLYKDKV